MEFGGARQAAVVSGRFDETIYVASAVSLLLCQGLDLWNDAGLAGRKAAPPFLAVSASKYAIVPSTGKGIACAVEPATMRDTAGGTVAPAARCSWSSARTPRPTISDIAVGELSATRRGRGDRSNVARRGIPR